MRREIPERVRDPVRSINDLVRSIRDLVRSIRDLVRCKIRQLVCLLNRAVNRIIMIKRSVVVRLSAECKAICVCLCVRADDL